MLDIRWIRSNIEETKRFLTNRNNDMNIDALLSLDTEKRSLLVESEELKAKRNEGSRKVSQAKAAGEDASGLMEEMRLVGERVKTIDARITEIDATLDDLLLRVPNRPHETCPVGRDENDNVEIRKSGEVPTFPFEPKPHWEIGEALGIMDFERGAALAQSRFTVLKGLGAKVERALLNFMLDLHTEKHGYKEIEPPFMVNSATMQGTGQLPKFGPPARLKTPDGKDITWYIFPSFECMDWDGDGTVTRSEILQSLYAVTATREHAGNRECTTFRWRRSGETILMDCTTVFGEP